MSSAETAAVASGIAPALAIRGLTAGYSDTPIVYDVDIDVMPGKVVAVVGPNGAGKSTLLKAILGVARLLNGRIELNGQDVTGLPLPKLARAGIGYVPQVDDVFDGLRVRENLDMGGYLFGARERAARAEKALEVFPSLRTKLTRFVETLSGGERKMTAIARVLMLDPAVLLLDEPTAGLSPELSRTVLEQQVRMLGDHGKSVLLVEQKAVAALGVADWAYMMVRGRVVMSASGAEVLANPDMREIFLGAQGPGDAADAKEPDETQ
ncbi:MAG TPA: ABC transporter ATP-binding protein [Candidatus Sulfotelmatobacter sp.]|nr:ABC transporter ATP-binding protein [Candidatus Sulfotelmatobacter sp.]